MHNVLAVMTRRWQSQDYLQLVLINLLKLLLSVALLCSPAWHQEFWTLHMHTAYH